MIKLPSHIVFLCSRLDLPGGIERATVNTANLFAEKNHEVTLLVLDESAPSFYPIHQNVIIIHQPLSFGITPDGNIISRKITLLGDVLKLKKLLKQINPDLIIATEYPFATAAILSGGKKIAPVISWEHHHFFELKRNYFWEKMFQLSYPRLNTIVCLNEDEKKIFESINQSFVIPNFISPVYPSLSTESKMILTVARLTHVKGIDLLLATAKIILTKFPDWQWKIIGDGNMKGSVVQFIKDEKLEDRLILQMPVDHGILSEYQSASLYVMTSRNECFPMTLLEAQSSALPCVAFDCETGPRHIITENKNGLLVEKESPSKMADSIALLINNPELRKNMGINAIENIKRFSPDKVYSLWRQLFTTMEV